jgi:hypothetical protein
MHCAIAPGEGPCWTISDVSLHGTSLRYDDGLTVPLLRRVPTMLPESGSLILAGMVELAIEISRPQIAGEPTEDDDELDSLWMKPKLTPQQYEFAQQITAPRREIPPSFRTPAPSELALVRGETSRSVLRHFNKLTMIPTISRHLELAGKMNFERRAEIADVLVRLFPQLGEHRQGPSGGRPGQ